MPTIIRNLPYFDRSTTVDVRGRSHVVKRDQIIVWVSIVEKGVSSFHPNSPRFPAILDTGNNHNFLVSQQHLADWAGIQFKYLRRLQDTRVAGQVVSQLAANVYLHPNEPGQRDDFSDQQPFLLELQPGIAVVPATAEAPHPRLPVVGLRAFRIPGLQLSIDCLRCRVSIQTKKRFWIFS